MTGVPKQKTYARCYEAGEYKLQKQVVRKVTNDPFDLVATEPRTARHPGYTVFQELV